MRLRHLALASVPVAALTGLLLGCGGKAPPAEKSDPNVRIEPSSAESRNVDVGSLLYSPQPAPVFPTVARSEPIVISQALVSFEERQVISAEVDAAIELFATPITPEEVARLRAAKEDHKIVYHPRDKMQSVPMKRLAESDEVEEGQVLAYLDDQQVDARIRGSKAIKEAAEVALTYATEGAKLAEKRVGIVQKAVDSGTGSVSDLIDAQLQLARFRENVSTSIQTIAKTTAELEESTVLLAKHKVKSRVKGVIRSLAKRPGEYVKAGDKIMEIEATNRVRIEGNLDVQYAPYVRRGMTVDVEPAVPSAAQAYHTGHRQAVTGVAVTAHLDGPLVVSVGADGGALVWDPNLGQKPNRPTVAHNLPHPVGVRSVAATPATAKALLVITGGDDGKIRIWDVSNRDKLPIVPKVEPEEAHTAAVRAIAISPDGRFFATAAGRDVFVWELASTKKLYALPTEHRDDITAINFTPQDTFVTASKDGTLKVWKLGTERAAVVRTLDHRAGGVEALGTSRDGARVLFDQDKGRVDLVDPANGQTIGQLQNVSTTGSFSTLAIFAPDEGVAKLTDQTLKALRKSKKVPDSVLSKLETLKGKEMRLEDVEREITKLLSADEKDRYLSLILRQVLPPYSIATAGGDGDLKGTLQYWQAPRTGGRGAEVGRLVTPGRAPVTAAAFSPVRSEPFVVVGTSTGGVYLWKPPAETRETYTGRITFVDATDTRYVTVRVEMSNELNLLDHSAATIIVQTNQ